MSAQYKAPKFELKAKRVAEIPFTGTVGTLVYTTLVSGIITYPFRITRVKMVFPYTARNLVEHRVYTSRTESAPTTDWPTDMNIFGREAPVAGFRGEGIIKVVDCNVEVTEPGSRIKMATYNGTGATHYINGTVTIEAM
jgi:hypothetical protein